MHAKAKLLAQHLTPVLQSGNFACKIS
jgi:hypothetical protein